MNAFISVWLIGVMLAVCTEHIDWIIKMRSRRNRTDYIRHPVFEPGWGEWQDYLASSFWLLLLGWLLLPMVLLSWLAGWKHSDPGRDSSSWYIEPYSPARWWQFWRIGTR